MLTVEGEHGWQPLIVHSGPRGAPVKSLHDQNMFNLSQLIRTNVGGVESWHFHCHCDAGSLPLCVPRCLCYKSVKSYYKLWIIKYASYLTTSDRRSRKSGCDQLLVMGMKTIEWLTEFIPGTFNGSRASYKPNDRTTQTFERRVEDINFSRPETTDRPNIFFFFFFLM